MRAEYDEHSRNREEVYVRLLWKRHDLKPVILKHVKASHGVLPAVRLVNCVPNRNPEEIVSYQKERSLGLLACGMLFSPARKRA